MGSHWAGMILSRCCAILFSMRPLGQRRGWTGPGADAYRVTAGRSAEQPPVLPAELGRAVVPDTVADAGMKLA
jgi:hypothetical protein